MAPVELINFELLEKVVSKMVDVVEMILSVDDDTHLNSFGVDLILSELELELDEPVDRLVSVDS